MINEKASLVQIPSGYKSGTLYSVVPNTSAGDFTVTRGSTATRVNKDGLIESVAANVPRLNYDPSNPQDPHLLLEPERTNIAQNSNELNTGWAHSECTLTPNQVVAPDGSNTGSFVERTSTVQARVERGINLTDQNYTWSCFVKKGNQRYAFISVFLVTSAVSVDTIFDFDTESIVFSSSAVIANSVVEYSNGWYRLTTTFDALASQTAFVKVGSTSSTTVFSTGNVGDTIYVWGAQLEAGTYATSYIPTTIAVTREKDRCTGGGDSNLFNDNEGVLFVDIEALADNDTNFRYISLSDGTATNAILIQYRNNGDLRIYNGGTGTSNLIFSDFGINQTVRKKIAIQYGTTANDYKVYIDGVSKTVSGSFTATAISGLDRFRFDYATDGLEFFSKVHQAIIFNEALTDAELITLTT